MRCSARLNWAVGSHQGQPFIGPDRVILFEPDRFNTYSTLHDGRKHTITRRQLAITPGYAFTDYKSQGQTIEYVFVDLAKPPSGSQLTPFNAYVALSRSRGRTILRDFDDKLFTVHPSEDLRLEDERLLELARMTTEDTEGGGYR